MPADLYTQLTRPGLLFLTIWPVALRMEAELVELYVGVLYYDHDTKVVQANSFAFSSPATSELTGTQIIVIGQYVDGS